MGVDTTAQKSGADQTDHHSHGEQARRLVSTDNPLKVIATDRIVTPMAKSPCSRIACPTLASSLSVSNFASPIPERYFPDPLLVHQETGFPIASNKATLVRKIDFHPRRFHSLTLNDLLRPSDQDLIGGNTGRRAHRRQQGHVSHGSNRDHLVLIGPILRRVLLHVSDGMLATFNIRGHMAAGKSEHRLECPDLFLLF